MSQLDRGFVDRHHASHDAEGPAPGKRTLTHAIQRRAARPTPSASAPAAAAPAIDAAAPFWFADGAPAGEVAPAAIESAAARGVATPTSALPHADAIATSFGRHAPTDVLAHVGPDAGAAARDMGAAAFATGNHVVLGDTSLHTVAHEAAHVVQQRAGVHLKTGDDTSSDPWERHADQVADAVVGGRSAEALFDTLPTGGHSSGAGSVQRMKIDDDGSYARLWGDHDTEKAREFAAWIGRLEAQGNTAVLEKTLASLHRDHFDMADHESRARSLVQRTLDRMQQAHHPAPPQQQGRNPNLGNLPRDQWWKLFIEGDKHDRPDDEQNAMRFDNESSPGYYAAMSGSFEREVAGTDGHQLGFGDYNRMHEGVTRDTLAEHDGGFTPVPHRLSAADISYPMTKTQAPNPQALREMLTEGTLGLEPEMQANLVRHVQALGATERDELDAWSAQLASDHATGVQRDALGGNGTMLFEVIGGLYAGQGAPHEYKSMLHPTRVVGNRPKDEQPMQLNVHTNRDPGQAEGEVNGLFGRYYGRLALIDRDRELEGQAAEYEKLKAIGSLVRALHVGHYFHDANGRLNTMVLLNRLMIDAGFHPVIMQRTDIFGGECSADELVEAIRIGLEAFQREVAMAHPGLGQQGHPTHDDDRPQPGHFPGDIGGAHDNNDLGQ